MKYLLARIWVWISDYFNPEDRADLGVIRTIFTLIVPTFVLVIFGAINLAEHNIIPLKELFRVLILYFGGYSTISFLLYFVPKAISFIDDLDSNCRGLVQEVRDKKRREQLAKRERIPTNMDLELDI